MQKSSTSIECEQMVNEIREASRRVELAYEVLNALIRRQVEKQKDGGE